MLVKEKQLVSIHELQNWIDLGVVTRW